MKPDEMTWEQYANALETDCYLFEKKIDNLETELAGMKLMEAEGESFGETIVRENEQLKEEITTWEAKAALFVDQGDEIERLRKERDALVRWNWKRAQKTILEAMKRYRQEEPEAGASNTTVSELIGFCELATQKEIEDEPA